MFRYIAIGIVAIVMFILLTAVLDTVQTARHTMVNKEQIRYD